MQPYIFPTISYFQLISSVDTFVIYDNVNFIKMGWINRNYLNYNGEKYFVTDKACNGLGEGQMTVEQLKTQRDSAKEDYEARIESNTLVPLVYSIIMGDLVDQSKKAMENMSEDKKSQLQDLIKEGDD